jgi:hypothetical protein
MLEKTRKTPARKKTANPAAKAAAPNAALPPAPQTRVTQGSSVVAAGAGTPGAHAAPGQSAPRTPVTAEQRWRMVAEAAYFKAQRRGFVGGDSKRDWAEAEAEIDAWLLESR